MRRSLKRLLYALVVLGLLAAGAAGWAYRSIQAVGEQPLTLAGSPQKLVITRGDTLTGIARKLQDRGVIDNALWLRLYGRLNDRASRLQAGEYRLQPGMNVNDALSKMERGEVIQYEITIVEGWTFREMITALARHDAVKHTVGDLSDADIMKRLGAAGEHPEGQFLPETYRFTRGSRDIDLLRRAHEAMSKALENVWSKRDDNLPLQTSYDALILASIVEKETAVPDERTRIAGVFVRRLRRGMRLQTDPTVIYGLGDAYDGNIRHRDLRHDTPYNTYTRRGLPPTPIAMPGIDSIRAAVHPSTGDALYFVATGDGSHHFSATLTEHNRAVRKYQLGQK